VASVHRFFSSRCGPRACSQSGDRAPATGIDIDFHFRYNGMQEIIDMKSRAFTLIELLVVIAIIGTSHSRS
jgi:prepilin-type N-terminal cleavage/methylation domain-containing protein